MTTPSHPGVGGSLGLPPHGMSPSVDARPAPVRHGTPRHEGVGSVRIPLSLKAPAGPINVSGSNALPPDRASVRHHCTGCQGATLTVRFASVLRPEGDKPAPVRPLHRITGIAASPHEIDQGIRPESREELPGLTRLQTGLKGHDGLKRLAALL